MASSPLAGLLDRPALVLEGHLHGRADALVVLDGQDARAHSTMCRIQTFPDVRVRSARGCGGTSLGRASCRVGSSPTRSSSRRPRRRGASARHVHGRSRRGAARPAVATDRPRRAAARAVRCSTSAAAAGRRRWPWCRRRRRSSASTSARTRSSASRRLRRPGVPLPDGRGRVAGRRAVGGGGRRGRVPPRALQRARRRGVRAAADRARPADGRVELDAVHPLVYLAPLWQHFWKLDRPDGPTAGDVVAVVRELGIEPRVALAERPAGTGARPTSRCSWPAGGCACPRRATPRSPRRWPCCRRPRPTSGPSPGPADA